jgi:hypothetical protein
VHKSRPQEAIIDDVYFASYKQDGNPAWQEGALILGRMRRYDAIIPRAYWGPRALGGDSRISNF